MINEDTLTLYYYKDGLTDDERRTMNAHPEIGAAIVRGVTWLEDAREVIRYHHEWYDGSGYPRGLSGEGIPLSARIGAVADVYDALVHTRVYRPAMTERQAVEIMSRARGKHYH